MAAVDVYASFQLNTGETVDMKTNMTEGTEKELVVSTKYAVSAVSIGQYAEGKVITQITQPPSSANLVSYAYVDRRGEILCVLPVASRGVQAAPCPMPFRFTLQAGDTIRVLTNTATNRTFAYSVITADNTHAIFSGTAANGDVSLTHIKSGQGLGASLTGKSIVSHYATSIDDDKLESGGGVYILNDRGLPLGGTAATNPLNLQPKANSMGGANIQLNFVARVTCSS